MSTLITRSVATMSWIDPRTGLPEVDKRGDPGEQVPRDTILGQLAYRFANFLEAFLRVDKDGKVLKYGFTEASGMYRNLSFLKIPSEPFDIIRNKPISAGSSVCFSQLVGCRTQSPEIIAESVGSIGGPIGAQIGREIVEEIMVFPPIWTELEMTIYADGWFEGRLRRHSIFPSLNFYRRRETILVGGQGGMELVYDPRFTEVIPKPGDVRIAGTKMSLAGFPEGQWEHEVRPRGMAFSFANSEFSNADEKMYDLVSEYDAVPNLDTWKKRGWGGLEAGASGPTGGNPWSIKSPRGLGSGRTGDQPDRHTGTFP
jgi:hypothetical protein